MSEQQHRERDPFAPVDIPTRGATVYVVLAFLAAFAALWNVLPIFTGPVGMALGLVAHLKQHRLGFPAAVVAGIATLVGLALQLLLFNPSVA